MISFSSRFLTILFALLGACGCRKKDATSSDAGVAAADAAAAAFLPGADAPFAVARSARSTLIATTSTTPPALGVLEIGADGREVGRALIASFAQPLAVPPALHAFPSGGAAVIYGEKPGDALRAVMLGSDRKRVGDPTAVGLEWCTTDDALVFLDRTTRRVRVWDAGKPAPRDGDAMQVDERASVLCGAHHSFVIEPRGTSFHVLVTGRGVRVPLASGIDPSAGGASAFYTSGDTVGLVAVASEAHLVWATIGAGDASPNARSLSIKVLAEQTLVVADGTADRLSLLLQREGRKRCREEEPPPSYELLEVVAGGGRVKERALPMPVIPCDVEASVPEVERTQAGTIVRWFETKDEERTKRLRTWTVPTMGEPKIAERTVSADAVLSTCDHGCAAVVRDGASFRIERDP